MALAVGQILSVYVVMTQFLEIVSVIVCVIRRLQVKFLTMMSFMLL